MNYFFLDNRTRVYVLQTKGQLSENQLQVLTWLFDGAEQIEQDHPFLKNRFKGPRRELPTPWSTVATEICHGINIPGIVRIEEFFPLAEQEPYDYTFHEEYKGLEDPVFYSKRYANRYAALQILQHTTGKKAWPLARKRSNTWNCWHNVWAGR